jgi:hypothetical protein
LRGEGDAMNEGERFAAVTLSRRSATPSPLKGEGNKERSFQ